MRESLVSYALPGVIHFMAYPEVMRGEGPVLQTLRTLLEDPYFHAIEVSWMKDPAVRREAAAMIAQSGVAAAYGAQPRFLTTGLNPNDLDEAGRRLAEASLLEGVEEAASLGCRQAAFLAGPFDPARVAEAMDALCRTTEVAARRAEALGLRLSLEVFDFDADKRSLIGPAPRAAAFAARMAGLGGFGLTVDLSHLPLLGETAEEAIAPTAAHITHVHLGNAVLDANSPACGDQHPCFGYPGSANGLPEMVQFLHALLRHGVLAPEKRPLMSFEIKPQPGEDTTLILAGGKRMLEQAWAVC